MDAGQIKTGEDAYDTYVKMLQEVVRVTPQIAHGIASEYPSVIELVRAMKMHGSLLLEDVKVRSFKYSPCDGELIYLIEVLQQEWPDDRCKSWSGYQ